MKAQPSTPAKPFGGYGDPNAAITGKPSAPSAMGQAAPVTGKPAAPSASGYDPGYLAKGVSFNDSGGSVPLQENAQAPTSAPPGYYYRSDGMLLPDQNYGISTSTTQTTSANPGLNTAHGDFGPTVNTFAPSGPINSTGPTAGQVQNTFNTGGPIQTKLDLSELGDYQKGASYGAIQNSLDNSNVPGVAGGSDLERQMTQAQNAAYQNATGYLDPQWKSGQSDLESKMVNQGVMQNSEAWNKAADDFARQKTFAYDQAYTGAYDKGLAAQNQLYGQALSSNQNQFGQNLASGQFYNSAQAQGAQQSQFNAQMANFARSQQANELMAQMQLGNAAQGQLYGQNANTANFFNNAQNQRFGQGMASQAANNAAQNQGFQQNMARAGFTNATQQQLADQWLRQFQTETGLRQTETSANAQMAAANASASVGMAGVNAGIEQNRFLNSMTMRNQGLYENQLPAQYLMQMMAGLGGNGVQQPNFANFPGGGMGNTDITGPYNNAYNGALNTYNTNVGSQNSQNSAISSMIAAWLMSDRRLKKNVVQIGEHRVGVPLYEFDYLWGEHAIGVMADDLESVCPDAVLTLPCGYKAVDYGRI